MLIWNPSILFFYSTLWCYRCTLVFIFTIYFCIMSLNACSVGTFTNDSNNCHKKSFIKKLDLTFIENLTETEKECLLWRSNLRRLDASQNSNLTMSHHHKLLFLSKFTRKQTPCCDLFGLQPKIWKINTLQWSQGWNYVLIIPEVKYVKLI